MCELFAKLPYEVQSFIFECLPLTCIIPFLQIEEYTGLVLDRLPKDGLQLSLTNFSFETACSILGFNLEPAKLDRDAIFVNSSSFEILLQWSLSNRLPSMKHLVLLLRNLNQDATALLLDVSGKLQSLIMSFDSLKIEVIDKNSSIEIPFDKYKTIIDGLCDKTENDFCEFMKHSESLEISKNGVKCLSTSESEVDRTLSNISTYTDWLWDSNHPFDSSVESLAIEVSGMGRSGSKESGFIFENYTNIRMLSLEVYVPWEVINNYRSLRVLKLNRIDFEGIHVVDLPILEVLDIHNCFIQKFDAVTLTNLKCLTIQNCSSFTSLLNLHPKIEELNLKQNKSLETNSLFESNTVYENMRTLSLGPSKVFLNLNLERSTPSLKRLDIKLKVKKLEISLYPRTLNHLIIESSNIGDIATNFDHLESLVSLDIREGFLRAERLLLPCTLESLRLFNLKVSGRLDFKKLSVELKRLSIERCNFLSNEPDSSILVFPPNWSLSYLILKSCKNLPTPNLLKDISKMTLFMYTAESINRNFPKKGMSNSWWIFEGHYDPSRVDKPYGILQVDISKHEQIFRDKFDLQKNSLPSLYYVEF